MFRQTAAILLLAVVTIFPVSVSASSALSTAPILQNQVLDGLAGLLRSLGNYFAVQPSGPVSQQVAAGGTYSFAGAGRIDTLSNATIQNSVISGSSISGTSIAGFSNALTSNSYASSSDILNAAHIAAWGDSLTSGANSAIPFTTNLAQLTGLTIYNGGVGGETSTQIKVRMLAATDKYNWPTIIWAGRNDSGSPSTVKANIAEMVAALGTQNYLVLGILNANSEPSGSGTYTTITQLNSDLAATYGTHFIDIRAYLVSQYNSGIAQDIADHANDVPPTSLRSDSLHLNSAGNAKVAARIYQAISILQPTSSQSALTPSNALLLFANPPTIGSLTPGAAYFSRLAIGTTTNPSLLTIDAGGSANASAITFSGLQQTNNTILNLKNAVTNTGWSLRSSGGEQEFFNVADTYLGNILSINTGSSTNASYINAMTFGFGTTSASSKVQINGTGATSGSNPLLAFSDIGGAPANIIGVRTAAGNSGWTLQSAGGSAEFFNLNAPGTSPPTILGLYTGSGSLNSYWNPQNSGSRFGFGTTSPLSKIAVSGNASIGAAYNIAAPTNGLLVQGSVGIGTTSPWRTLSISGTVGFDGLTGTTGAGSLCLTTNREVVFNSGSDSCLPSLRALKHEIAPLPIDAFAQIKALQPVSFIYNDDASSTVRYGFIAEDTANVDAHLATYNQTGAISGVDDRALLSVAVSALQKVIHQVADFADHVTTKELTFTRATGEEIDVHRLCLDGLCVTKVELQALLNQVGQQTPPASTPDDSATTAEPSDDAATTTEPGSDTP